MKSLFCVAFAALAALGGEARAETFVVTRFDDPIPDGCAVSDCSLREAAEAASVKDPLGPRDFIQLAAGSYTLTRGEMPIAKQGLDVYGAGSAQTDIGSDATLFASYGASARSLGLHGLGMHTSDFNVLSSSNGGGHFVLEDVSVPVGGGSLSFGGDQNEVEIRDSDIRDTLRCNVFAGRCAIRDSLLLNLYVIPAVGSTVTVLVQGSIVDGDIDPGRSTIALHHGASIDIEDTTIAHTDVHVLNSGPPTHLRRVLYLDSIAPIRADVAADMLIEDSELRDNTVRAIRADSGSNWTVRGSSFIHNSVNGNAGGAIVVEGGASMDIRNSTFSGNSFTTEAANGGARGAAIGYRGNSGGANLLLRHLTIVPPTIVPVGIVGTAIGGFDGASVGVDISNSVVRGTCSFDGGALENNAGNIESPGNTCGFDSNVNMVSVTSTALALGTLGDHGGFTPTYEPAPESVAVDGGGAQQCLQLDQRGYLRPAGDGCDVGAVEVGAIADTLFRDGFDG